jgi:aryl-alcohol dehydrogenase-like predicted oxidoreductase
LAKVPLQIGRIGLGCIGMSEFYGGKLDEAGHIKTLHAAIDLGVNHFDTADMYGVGHNEKVISKAFSNRWDKVTLATKFGVLRGAPTVNGWASADGRST